MAVRG
jgi:DNA-binding SARP family transcriptional activator